MGKSQRVKGANGEREVAHLFCDAGIEARRGMRQAQDATGEPDVVLEELKELWIEVKRGKRTFPAAAMEQAEDAAGPTRMPIVISRDDHGKHLVSMRFNLFLRLLKNTYPGISRALELDFDKANKEAGPEHSRRSAAGKRAPRGEARADSADTQRPEVADTAGNP